mgnify:CR=1 FL=1
MCASRSPNADGTQIYAETVFPVQPVLAKEDAQEEVDEWQRFETILTPGVDDAHAVISITYTEQAQLLIGAVSMMPDNHFHTMRRDTVEKLKEIGVRLLRWPVATLPANIAGRICSCIPTGALPWRATWKMKRSPLHTAMTCMK